MMGATNSKRGNGSDAVVRRQTDQRIRDLIRQKERQPHETIHPFQKILLKFPFIRKTFKSIKTAFDRFDTDKNGTIEYDELESAMRHLGSSCEAANVREVFCEADFREDGHLTFKEFLVCLALGFLLGYIPFAEIDVEHSPTALSANERAAKAADEAQSRDAVTDESTSAGASGSTVNTSIPTGANVLSGTRVEKLKKLSIDELEASLRRGDGAALAYAFHLALEAFFQLDVHHSGVINRTELQEAMARLAMMSPSAMMKERERPDAGQRVDSLARSNILNFLTEERWQELDWDHDGQITFREFLLAFVAWVGIDEDDDDQDVAMTEASASAASVRSESFDLQSTGEASNRPHGGRSILKSTSIEDSTSSPPSRHVRIRGDAATDETEAK